MVNIKIKIAKRDVKIAQLVNGWIMTLTVRPVRIVSLANTKMKRVNPKMALFECAKCGLESESAMESEEELGDGVETVNWFCYLGDRISASGGCEAAVTARMRIAWSKFKEGGRCCMVKGSR